MGLVSRAVARKKRHLRLRKKISGVQAKPRLLVSRSNKHVFVQVIDDVRSRTFVSASTMEPELRDFVGDKRAKSRRVGLLVAERAQAAGISAVVFDRGGSQYTGRVAAVAEGAREGGLNL